LSGFGSLRLSREKRVKLGLRQAGLRAVVVGDAKPMGAGMLRGFIERSDGSRYEMRCSSASRVFADTRTISGRAAASASGSSALATPAFPNVNENARSATAMALVVLTKIAFKRVLMLYSVVD
jgi:hypothetical protein